MEKLETSESNHKLEKYSGANQCKGELSDVFKKSREIKKNLILSEKDKNPSCEGKNLKNSGEYSSEIEVGKLEVIKVKEEKDCDNSKNSILGKNHPNLPEQEVKNSVVKNIENPCCNKEIVDVPGSILNTDENKNDDKNNQVLDELESQENRSEENIWLLGNYFRQLTDTFKRSFRKKIDVKRKKEFLKYFKEAADSLDNIHVNKKHSMSLELTNNDDDFSSKPHDEKLASKKISHDFELKNSSGDDLQNNVIKNTKKDLIEKNSDNLQKPEKQKEHLHQQESGNKKLHDGFNNDSGTKEKEKVLKIKEEKDSDDSQKLKKIQKFSHLRELEEEKKQNDNLRNEILSHKDDEKKRGENIKIKEEKDSESREKEKAIEIKKEKDADKEKTQRLLNYFKQLDENLDRSLTNKKTPESPGLMNLRREVEGKNETGGILKIKEEKEILKNRPQDLEKSKQDGINFSSPLESEKKISKNDSLIRSFTNKNLENSIILPHSNENDLEKKKEKVVEIKKKNEVVAKNLNKSQTLENREKSFHDGKLATSLRLSNSTECNLIIKVTEKISGVQKNQETSSQNLDNSEKLKENHDNSNLLNRGKKKLHENSFDFSSSFSNEKNSEFTSVVKSPRIDFTTEHKDKNVGKGRKSVGKNAEKLEGNHNHSNLLNPGKEKLHENSSDFSSSFFNEKNSEITGLVKSPRIDFTTEHKDKNVEKEEKSVGKNAEKLEEDHKDSINCSSSKNLLKIVEMGEFGKDNSEKNEEEKTDKIKKKKKSLEKDDSKKEKKSENLLDEANDKNFNGSYYKNQKQEENVNKNKVVDEVLKKNSDDGKKSKKDKHRLSLSEKISKNSTNEIFPESVKLVESQQSYLDEKENEKAKKKKSLEQDDDDSLKPKKQKKNVLLSESEENKSSLYDKSFDCSITNDKLPEFIESANDIEENSKNKHKEKNSKVKKKKSRESTSEDFQKMENQLEKSSDGRFDRSSLVDGEIPELVELADSDKEYLETQDEEKKVKHKKKKKKKSLDKDAEDSKKCEKLLHDTNEINSEQFALVDSSADSSKSQEKNETVEKNKKDELLEKSCHDNSNCSTTKKIFPELVELIDSDQDDLGEKEDDKIVKIKKKKKKKKKSSEKDVDDSQERKESRKKSKMQENNSHDDDEEIKQKDESVKLKKKSKSMDGDIDNPQKIQLEESHNDSISNENLPEVKKSVDSGKIISEINEEGNTFKKTKKKKKSPKDNTDVSEKLENCKENSNILESEKNKSHDANENLPEVNKSVDSVEMISEINEEGNNIKKTKKKKKEKKKSLKDDTDVSEKLENCKENSNKLGSERNKSHDANENLPEVNKSADFVEIISEINEEGNTIKKTKKKKKSLKDDTGVSEKLEKCEENSNILELEKNKSHDANESLPEVIKSADSIEIISEINEEGNIIKKTKKKKKEKKKSLKDDTDVSEKLENCEENSNILELEKNKSHDANESLPEVIKSADSIEIISEINEEENTIKTKKKKKKKKEKKKSPEDDADVSEKLEKCKENSNMMESEKNQSTFISSNENLPELIELVDSDINKSGELQEETAKVKKKKKKKKKKLEENADDSQESLKLQTKLYDEKNKEISEQLEVTLSDEDILKIQKVDEIVADSNENETLKKNSKKLKKLKKDKNRSSSSERSEKKSHEILDSSLTDGKLPEMIELADSEDGDTEGTEKKKKKKSMKSKKREKSMDENVDDLEKSKKQKKNLGENKSHEESSIHSSPNVDDSEKLKKQKKNLGENKSHEESSIHSSKNVDDSEKSKKQKKNLGENKSHEESSIHSSKNVDDLEKLKKQKKNLGENKSHEESSIHSSKNVDDSEKSKKQKKNLEENKSHEESSIHSSKNVDDLEKSKKQKKNLGENKSHEESSIHSSPNEKLPELIELADSEEDRSDKNEISTDDQRKKKKKKKKRKKNPSESDAEKFEKLKKRKETSHEDVSEEIGSTSLIENGTRIHEREENIETEKKKESFGNDFDHSKKSKKDKSYSELKERGKKKLNLDGFDSSFTTINLSEVINSPDKDDSEKNVKIKKRKDNDDDTKKSKKRRKHSINLEIENAKRQNISMTNERISKQLDENNSKSNEKEILNTTENKLRKKSSVNSKKLTKDNNDLIFLGREKEKSHDNSLNCSFVNKKPRVVIEMAESEEDNLEESKKEQIVEVKKNKSSEKQNMSESRENKSHNDFNRSMTNEKFPELVELVDLDEEENSNINEKVKIIESKKRKIISKENFDSTEKRVEDLNLSINPNRDSSKNETNEITIELSHENNSDEEEAERLESYFSLLDESLNNPSAESEGKKQITGGKIEKRKREKSLDESLSNKKLPSWLGLSDSENDLEKDEEVKNIETKNGKNYKDSDEEETNRLEDYFRHLDGENDFGDCRKILQTEGFEKIIPHNNITKNIDHRFLQKQIKYDIDDDDEFFGSAEVKKISDEEAMLLRSMEIKLNHTVPPQHQIESRAGGMTPLLSEKKEFEKYINLKSGLFNHEEDKLICRNWKEFCLLNNWDEKIVEPFMKWRHNGSYYIPCIKERKKFIQFLARDLNNRSLYSVFHRFKVLNSDNKTSRYSDMEDQYILNFMSKHPEVLDKFSVIGMKLKRTRHSVWRRYRILCKNI